MPILKKISIYLDSLFEISLRNSSIKKEIIAGCTTFLSMVYSVILVPNMLEKAGFPHNLVFVSTCLVAIFGSIIMGLWANLPMAVGCAISLAAFTSFSLVLGKNLSIPVSLGTIFLMGIFFTGISLTGIRTWILRNIPQGVGQGTGIGIGLFLLLIASDSVGLIVKNNHPGALPVTLGDFSSFPILLSILGLSIICGFEKRQIPGSILLTIIIISTIGFIIDPKVTYKGLFSMPVLQKDSYNYLIFSLDIKHALNPTILAEILALVVTAVFDATSTIKAVAAQANLLDHKNDILNGKKAVIADSISSVFAGIVGTSPAAVYIESAAGTASGGKTGLTAVVVGILFILILFMSPIAYLVPNYATAPVLMYVGLLMLSNVSKIDFSDFIDAFSGLLVAVFIVFSCNIVTGIMLGCITLVISRIVSGEFYKLTFGTIVISIALIMFYLSGWAI